MEGEARGVLEVSTRLRYFRQVSVSGRAEATREPMGTWKTQGGHEKELGKVRGGGGCIKGFFFQMNLLKALLNDL